MSTKILFRVWDKTRTNKILVALEESTDDLLEVLILKASTKLEIDGSHLTLESDGSKIDDSEVLRCLSNETLILLQKNEKWCSKDVQDARSSTSTITIPSFLSDEDLASIIDDSSASPSRSDISAEDSPNCNINENTWLSMPLPFETMSKETINDCIAGKKNIHVSTTEVIHMAVKQMRQIKTYLPSSAIKIIARRIVEKFPDMFLDKDDDGIIIGDRIHTIVQKLQDRNNYLNRPHKKRSLLKEIELPRKKIKIMNNAKSGCANWQPDASETEETLENQRQILMTAIWDNSDHVKTLMDNTYPLQRKYLNNSTPPSMDNIKKAWPLLLNYDAMKWHYQKLMGHKIENLSTGLLKKAKAIIEFGKPKDQKGSVNENREEILLLEAIKCIAAHFKENANLLLVEFEEGTPKNELKGIILAPSILHVKDSGDTYYVSIEGQIIEGDQMKFENALQIAFASYYIFNMEYPKELSCTLEFLQRYIMKIHPDTGSRAKKGSLNKVLCYMNKLKKFILQ